MAGKGLPKKPRAKGAFAKLYDWAEARGGNVGIEYASKTQMLLIDVELPDQPVVSRYLHKDEGFDDCAAIVLQALLKGT